MEREEREGEQKRIDELTAGIEAIL